MDRIVESVMIFFILSGLGILFMVLLMNWVDKQPVHRRDIPKAQQAAIDRAHAEYLARTGMVENATPKGRLLFEIDEFRIHEDGILAKFDVGESGIWRFRRFGDILAIYPFEFHSTGRSKAIWKGLQIETKDYASFDVSGWNKKFPLVLPILQKAYGPGWNEVFRESEPIIESGLLAPTRIGLHSFLRNES